MDTPFGKFLEKNFFKKFFSIFILFSAAIGAVMNTHAVKILLQKDWLAYLIGILYLAMGISALMQNEIMKKWHNKKLETIMGIYSCFFIYDCMLLLLWLIFSCLFSMSHHIQTIGIFCIDLIAVIIVMAGYFHAKQIKYTSYSVHLGLKENSYRIAMLSDIHLGVYVDEKHILKIADKVNHLNPDLVVICGDLIDVNNHILEDDKELAKISSVFQKIKAKDGVFAVLGNHDPNIANKRFHDFLNASHIQLLHNQVIQISGLNLVGRTDASNNERCSMESLATQIHPALPTIVLAHNPAGIRQAIPFQVDLVLSGHTHKGQFIPVTYFTKLANGKHYFYGHEQFGKTHAIISSGAGFFQLPVRIGTSNEIVDLHLT